MKTKTNYVKIPQILCVTSILLIVGWKSLEQNRTTHIRDSHRNIATDPLASWNEGTVKQPIIDYVTSVGDHNSKNFLPEIDRIATFDNDGTLWAERPYVQELG